MNPMAVFYFGALALFGLSALLMRGMASRATMSGDQYDKRRRRRDIGVALLIMAIFSLGMGVFVQFSTNYPQLRQPGVGPVDTVESVNLEK